MFRATLDTSKTFYALADEADLDCFVQLYDQDPNLQEKTVQQTGSLKNSGKNVSLPKNDFVSKLNYSSNFGNVLFSWYIIFNYSY